MLKITSLLVLAGLVAGCGPRERVDTLLFNGRVVTLDAGSRVAEAIAIRGAQVVAVGSDDELGGLEAGRRIDLGGKTVVPGFADNHYHSIGGGPGVDLSRTRSLQEVLDAIAATAARTPEGEVVVTNSDWHEGQLAEQRLPYRDDLDRASSRHPVVVVRGGHEYILNSRALARWGIDASTESPAGGSIGRYPDARLNGELVDAAKRFVELPAPGELDSEGRLAALAGELRRLNAVGLTSIRQASASPELYRSLAELRRRGELGVRVSALLRVLPATAAEQLEPMLESWGIGPDEGDEWLRVAGIKLGVDGGFEGGWMRDAYQEPFGEAGSYFGLQTFPTPQFAATVRELNRLGWRVGTHAVGDAAIDLVLDGYRQAHAEQSIAGKRWAIEHGFIPRQHQFEAMREMQLFITAQHHLYLAAPSLVKYWGRERAERVTPVRAYLDAGLNVSLGSDAPVVPYPPLWVLYHFITRDTISGGVMGAGQRIGREQALRAMSLGGAALSFEEGVKGSLEAGKLADLVVLSDDIMSCAPERIRDMEVLVTMVGGRIVFEK